MAAVLVVVLGIVQEVAKAVALVDAVEVVREGAIIIVATTAAIFVKEIAVVHAVVVVLELVLVFARMDVRMPVVENVLGLV